MRIIILLLFIITFSKISFAKVPQAFALHINGINVTPYEAKENSNILKKTSDVKQFNYALVYNPTRTPNEWSWWAKLKGFIDVCKQKWFESHFLPTLDEFTQQAMKAQGFDFPIDSQEYRQFKSMLTQEFENLLLDKGGKNMQTIIDEFHDTVPVEFMDVVKLLNADHDYSKSKDYVILLPHSQGNLYANNLYTYLTQIEHFDKSRITIFGFATPAQEELGQMECNNQIPNYVTSTNDGIIELARKWMPSNILHSNILIAPTIADTSGHSLIDVYLLDPYTSIRYNSFMSYTSINCFKDLHNFEPLANLPNANSRIIYNKKHNSIFQIDSKKALCKFDLNIKNSVWNCEPIDSDILYIDWSTLTTDGGDNVYFLGSQESLYLFNLNLIDKSINKISLDNLNYSSNLIYQNYKIYYKSNYDLISIDLLSKQKNKIPMFENIGEVSTYFDIDNLGNIFFASIDPNDYRKNAQIYYRNVDNNIPIFLFGKPTARRYVFDIHVSSRNIFLCGADKIYYAPLDLNNPPPWSIIDTECSQIISDDKSIYITTSSGSFRRFSLN